MGNVLDNESFQASLVKPKPLSQQVASLLIQEVRSGAFIAGQRLPSEAELMKRYGVSRTVIREALASMKYDGILSSQPGAGMIVNDLKDRYAFRVSDIFSEISREEVNHLYEMRCGLESEAAALAAIRATPQDIEELQKQFAAMEDAVACHEPGTVAHALFNQAIAQASHNPVYVEFLSFLCSQMRALSGKLRLRTMLDPCRTDVVRAEHKAIIGAIVSRDPERSRVAVRTHLQHAALRSGLKIYVV